MPDPGTGGDLGGSDRKHHIVAPPGSGKTIVGLELIRRFGEPAVVFVPTATIQQQWCEEVGLFTRGPPRDLVSREPGRSVPINVFTYQLISAPGESGELLKETAREMWFEELSGEGGDSDGFVEATHERLETIRRNTPALTARSWVAAPGGPSAVSCVAGTPTSPAFYTPMLAPV